MGINRKRVFKGLLFLFAVILVAAALYINSLLPIITGYAAKNLCSAVFISGREQTEMEAADLSFSFIRFNKNVVDFENKSVTSRFLWGKSKAIYRDGFGATLIRNTTEEELLKTKFPDGLDAEYNQDTLEWPLGDIISDQVIADINEIDSAVHNAVSNSGYNGNIYAMVVLQDGNLVAEAYKPQFNKDTRFLSWSMAKSITNALIGIMVKQGLIEVTESELLAEWMNDERRNITLDNLLRMQSGLEWNEDYGNRSDVTVMLHCEDDMGEFALQKESGHEAGTDWYYSSGTTNIVSKIIRNKIGEDPEYYAFAKRELFNKTGMPDAILETDPSGTFISSSYLYATARDYARFALLYMNDGIFNQQRILPEGWVQYSTTETELSDGKYGAFFWINKSKRVLTAPDDMFSCNGHDGQYIFMIPSKNIVVVVLGYSPDGLDVDDLLGDILEAA